MSKVCGLATFTSVEFPDMLEHAKRVVKRFEQLNDMPVQLVTASDAVALPLFDPHFARYFAWRLVPASVEKIIYFDTDILPLWPLPELPDVDFAAVPENSKHADFMRAKTPMLKSVDAYFNSGFFIASRKTEAVFDRMVARQTSAKYGPKPQLWDQPLLNVEVQTAVCMNEITYQSLPLKWCSPHWELEPDMAPAMVHLPSGDWKYKTRVIGHVCAAIDEADETLRKVSTK